MPDYSERMDMGNDVFEVTDDWNDEWPDYVVVDEWEDYGDDIDWLDHSYDSCINYDACEVFDCDEGSFCIATVC